MIKTKKWRDAEAESDVNMNTEDWMADEIDGLREELTEVYKQHAELLEALKLIKDHPSNDAYEIRQYAVAAITRAAAQIEMAECKDN